MRGYSNGQQLRIQRYNKRTLNASGVNAVQSKQQNGWRDGWRDGGIEGEREGWSDVEDTRKVPRGRDAAVGKTNRHRQ